MTGLLAGSTAVVSSMGCPLGYGPRRHRCPGSRPGLLDSDPSIEQPRAPRHWGRYAFGNGSGTLTLPWGTVLQATVTSLELTVSRQDHSNIHASTPDAQQRDGTWCLDDQHCIRLGVEGRFEDSGAVQVLGHATHPFPESSPRRISCA